MDTGKPLGIIYQTRSSRSRRIACSNNSTIVGLQRPGSVCFEGTGGGSRLVSFAKRERKLSGNILSVTFTPRSIAERIRTARFGILSSGADASGGPILDGATCAASDAP